MGLIYNRSEVYAPQTGLVGPWVSGTAEVLAATNPVIPSGAYGMEVDTGRSKTGDGVTAWVSLSYNAEVDAQIAPWQVGVDGQWANTFTPGTPQEVNGG